MSEKRYLIVSPSHHKKPRAMFLSEPADASKHPQWNYHTTFALLLTKSQIDTVCANALVSFITIEHNDDIEELARTGETKFIDYVNKVEKVRNTSRVFNVDGIKQMIQYTMRSLHEKTLKTQAKETSEPQENKRCYALYSKSADGSIKYFCDEKDAIVVALHKGQRVQIFTQSEAHELQHLPYTDEANADVWNVENIGLWNLGEPLETPEEKREYVLYRNQLYTSGFIYYERGGGETFDKSEAYVMTLSEVSDKIKELSAKGQYRWIHKKVKIEPAVESETPASKADSESKELSEGYIVYTQSAYQPAYIYYCGDDAKHLDERDIKNAVLFPYVTAVEVAKKLAVSSEYSGYTWRVKNKINAAKEETPAPEAKKRVGYVLYHSTERKEKLYAHYESNGVFVRVAGIVADAYRTRGDAQFAADVLNSNGDTNFGWKVEQVEF